MRKLVMLALLVAVLVPAGVALAASGPAPTPLPESPLDDSDTGVVTTQQVPVDPPMFTVIAGTLWKFKGPVDGKPGWVRIKVASSNNPGLVGKKVEAKLPAQVAVSFAPGTDRLHAQHVTVWIPRGSVNLVASAIEFG